MSENQTGCVIIVLVLLFITAVFGASYMVKSYRCSSGFAESNLESRYDIFVGCLVKTPDQGWIPAHNYRVL
jgi:hypothetical protein